MSLFQTYELDLDPGEKDMIEATVQPGYWHVYPRASIGSGGVRLCNGPSIKAEGSHEIVGLMAIRLPGRDTKISLENRSSAAVHLFITAACGFHISVERLESVGGVGPPFAPIDSQYVTLQVDPNLTNERVLVGTPNQIVITDRGAGSTVALSTPQDIHTAATPTFAALTITNNIIAGGVTIDGNLEFVGGQYITTTAAFLEIAPFGDLILSPGGDDVFVRPTTGMIAELHLDSDVFINATACARLLFIGHNDAGQNVTYAQIQGTVISNVDGAEKGDLYIQVMHDGAKTAMAHFRGGTGAAFNEAGLDLYFRVEAVDQPNALFVRGSDGYFGLGTATPVTKATIEGALTLKEQAAADACTATYGQFFVKTATPNQPWFADDVGNAQQIATIPWVNVKAYGAKGDGVVATGAGTNDDAAIAAAIAACTDGSVLYFPTGVYILTATVAFSGQSVTIRGDGPQQTILLFTGCNGITVTQTIGFHAAIIDGMTLMTDDPGTYTAMILTGDNVVSDRERNFVVRDIFIRPRVYYSDYWLNGIKLIEVWNTIIESCHIRGYGTGDVQMDYGIWGATDGEEPPIAKQNIGIRVSNCYFYDMNTAVYVEGESEGWVIDGCDMLAQSGVVWNTSTTMPSLVVSNCEINTSFRGINIAANLVGGGITNNNVYKTAGSTLNYYGISVAATCVDVRIANNKVYGAKTAAEVNVGISASGDFCTVIGNVVRDKDTGIDLTAPSSYTTVLGNSGTNNTVDVANAGTGNIVEHNAWI